MAIGLKKICYIIPEFLPYHAQLPHQIYEIRFCDKTADLVESSGFRSESGQLQQYLANFLNKSAAADLFDPVSDLEFVRR